PNLLPGAPSSLAKSFKVWAFFFFARCCSSSFCCCCCCCCWRSCWAFLKLRFCLSLSLFLEGRESSGDSCLDWVFAECARFGFAPVNNWCGRRLGVLVRERERQVGLEQAAPVSRCRATKLAHIVGVRCCSVAVSVVVLEWANCLELFD